MSDLIIRFLAGVVIVSTVLLVCLIRICCEDEEETNQEKPIDSGANNRRRYRGTEEDPEDLNSPPVTIHLLSEFMNIHQHLVTPVLPLMSFSENHTPSSTSPAKDQRKVHFKKNLSHQPGQVSQESQEESVQMSNYAQTSFITTKESQVDVHPPPTLPSPTTITNLVEENDIPIRKPSTTEIELSDSLKNSLTNEQDRTIIPQPTGKRPPLKRGYSLFSKRRSLGSETNLVAPGIAQMSLKAKLRRIHLYGKDPKFYPRSVDNILVLVQKNDFDYETEQWKLFWQEELKNETLGATRDPHKIVHCDSFLSFSSVTSPNFKDSNAGVQPKSPTQESKHFDEIDEKELIKQQCKCFRFQWFRNSRLRKTKKS